MRNNIFITVLLICFGIHVNAQTDSFFVRKPSAGIKCFGGFNTQEPDGKIGWAGMVGFFGDMPFNRKWSIGMEIRHGNTKFYKAGNEGEVAWNYRQDISSLETPLLLKRSFYAKGHKLFILGAGIGTGHGYLGAEVQKVDQQSPYSVLIAPRSNVTGWNVSYHFWMLSAYRDFNYTKKHKGFAGLEYHRRLFSDREYNVFTYLQDINGDHYENRTKFTVEYRLIYAVVGFYF